MRAVAARLQARRHLRPPTCRVRRGETRARLVLDLRPLLLPFRPTLEPSGHMNMTPDPCASRAADHCRVQEDRAASSSETISRPLLLSSEFTASPCVRSWRPSFRTTATHAPPLPFGTSAHRSTSPQGTTALRPTHRRTTTWGALTSMPPHQECRPQHVSTMATDPHATRPASGTSELSAAPAVSTRMKPQNTATTNQEVRVLDDRGRSGTAHRLAVAQHDVDPADSDRPAPPVTAGRPVRDQSLSRQRSAQCSTFRSTECAER